MAITKKELFVLEIPDGPTSTDWQVKISRVEQNGNVAYELRVTCGAETIVRKLDPLRFSKMMRHASLTPDEYFL